MSECLVLKFKVKKSILSNEYINLQAGKFYAKMLQK